MILSKTLLQGSEGLLPEEDWTVSSPDFQQAVLSIKTTAC